MKRHTPTANMDLSNVKVGRFFVKCYVIRCGFAVVIVKMFRGLTYCGHNNIHYNLSVKIL